MGGRRGKELQRKGRDIERDKGRKRDREGEEEG
jgi:hypothetical protein